MKKLLIIFVVVLFSCEIEKVEPEQKEMFCVYSDTGVKTDASCLPNCPPRWYFVTCLNEDEVHEVVGTYGIYWISYEWPLKDGYRIRENCDICN